MKNKVLLITEHPAPYWDVTISSLAERLDLNVAYCERRVNSKPWKNILEKERDTERFGFLNMLRLVFKHKNVLLGGYYRLDLALIFLFSIILKRRIFLFTDVPSEHKRSWLVKTLKGLLYSRCDLFLVSGKKGIDILMRNYNVNKNRIIYFPYGWSSFESIDVDNKVIKILVANRFIERKGYEVFYQSILKLLESKYEKYYEFEINIIGNGPLFEVYKEKMNKLKCLNIKFHGWVEYLDYVKLLKETHIFVHPSLFEPFGVPVCEAMCLGKVVVVSDGVMSGFDFVKHGVNGFLYDKNSAFDLAAILKSLISNEFLRIDVSNQAKQSMPVYSYLMDEFVKRI